MKLTLTSHRMQYARLWALGIVMGLSVVAATGYGGAPNSDEAESPGAFLLDIEGEVKIVWENAEEGISVADRSCVPLQTGTVILMPEEGRATLVTSDRAYSLAGGSRYRVHSSSVAEVGQDQDQDEENPLKPAVRARGNTNPGQKTRFIPSDLMTTVTPPVQRATRGAVTVMSPRGKTLTRTPEFIWTGDEEDTYQLTVVELNPTGQPARTFDFVDVKGCQISWKKTGWPKFKRGHHYMVVIKRNGERLTVPDATFQILADEEAKLLRQRLSAIEKDMGEGEAGRLIRASILMNQRWKCYGEARRLAVGLVKDNPRNIPYLKLLQHCYSALKMREGVKSVGAVISRVQNRKDGEQK